MFRLHLFSFPTITNHSIGEKWKTEIPGWENRESHRSFFERLLTEVCGATGSRQSLSNVKIGLGQTESETCYHESTQVIRNTGSSWKRKTNL